jgi:acetolactate synthase-1/2/3 large subunit
MLQNKRYSATDLVNPDFVKLAEAYSIKARHVVSRVELEPAIDEMLSHDGPYVLTIDVDKDMKVMPFIKPGSTVDNITLN